MAALDLARPSRRRCTPIVAELLAQLGRPARRVLHLLRHVGIVERGPHHAGPVLVAAQHDGPMRAAQSQNFGHLMVLPSLTLPSLWAGPLPLPRCRRGAFDLFILL